MTFTATDRTRDFRRPCEVTSVISPDLETGSLTVVVVGEDPKTFKMYRDALGGWTCQGRQIKNKAGKVVDIEWPDVSGIVSFYGTLPKIPDVEAYLARRRVEGPQI